MKSPAEQNVGQTVKLSIVFMVWFALTALLLTALFSEYPKWLH